MRRCFHLQNMSVMTVVRVAVVMSLLEAEKSSQCGKLRTRVVAVMMVSLVVTCRRSSREEVFPGTRLTNHLLSRASRKESTVASGCWCASNTSSHGSWTVVMTMARTGRRKHGLDTCHC